jgi:formylglycine-generating enzyme
VSSLRAAACGALVALAASCGPQQLPPESELVLYLDTDAPLPSASAPAVPYLFDHVRIDGVGADGTACDCTREFDLDAEMLKDGGASFGVIPSPGAVTRGGDRVRVRMYRIEDAVDDQPPASTTLDVTFVLPGIAANTVVDRTLFLPTEAVGQPQGQATPVATRAGSPNPSHVGTWPGAARVDCTGAARAGEVCIPGGAFWMGNVAAGERGQYSGDAQRLVTLAPFFIDETEVTVASFRAAGFVADELYAGIMDGSFQSYCTFTPKPGPFEDLPVTCLGWQTSRQYCLAKGGELPTEAQFEYVASGLSSGEYVWGSGEPACADAVLQRAGVGVLENDYGTCRTTPWGGAAPVASTMRDALVVGSGAVHDLVGNVTEAVLDAFQLSTGPCWSRPGVYVNPVCGPLPVDCGKAGVSTLVSYRGGRWTGDGYTALAAFRDFAPCNTLSPDRGFRCVRPGG